MSLHATSALLMLAGAVLGCHTGASSRDVLADSNNPKAHVPRSMPQASAAATIEGTGDPLVDYPAVRDAVAAGGTIYLKGHFDFGTDNVVHVAWDVEIIGETPIESGPVDPVTGNRDRRWPTVITGGGAAKAAVFWSDVKANVVIRNVHFDRYQYTAVQIRKAAYAEVSNCRITNGLPEVLPELPDYNKVAGLTIGGSPAVAGNVDYASVDHAVVKDNIISIADSYTPYGKPSVITSGIGLSGMLDGTRSVMGNLVKNFAHLGIFNTTGGITTIEHNRVVAGDRGDGIGFRKGIAADWYGRVHFEAPVPLGQVFVRANAIATDGEQAHGVIVNNWPANPLAEDTKIVIEDNRIHVDDPRQGVGIWAFGTFRNVTARNNEITGNMYLGAGMNAFNAERTGYAEDIDVAGNDIDVSGSTPAPSVIGIMFAGVVGSRIRNNTINTIDGHAGIVVWAHDRGSEGNTIVGNTLTGSAAYGLLVGDPAPWPDTRDNSFIANDLSGLSTNVAVFSDNRSSGNHFADNILGSAVGWGVHSAGVSNTFDNTTFSGDYRGFGLSPAFILLDRGSETSRIAALRDGSPPQSFDVCDQVVDLNTWFSPFTTTNVVPGYERCAAPDAELAAQVAAIVKRTAGAAAESKAGLRRRDPAGS